jgi:hypothetical protein
MKGGQKMSEQNDERDKWKIDGPKALPDTLPPPTVWPATLSLGVTLMAFGVVTSWIMSVTGVVLFLFGVGGWVEDLRHDQL